MAHQSLYRKYRPQTFDDVVGQQHITRTLRNAVAEDSVAHAYLFTGPRGTGKTTTARILAKALLCKNGPTPDPDVSCSECVDVAEGTHPDVFELDAASRTDVVTVREEIIGRLAYVPTRGTWKIYIIDEVHMLSTHSFNALLKSVEEPPPRTVFVLCTTHPQKVPETIHSRCQRFDFHRIGIEDIVGRLDHIAEQEQIAVAEGAFTLVAKHAAGGMRDAITTLEQLASFSGKDISLDDVEGLLGEVDVALLVELADIIASRDIAGCFRFVARLAQTGVDMTEFVRDLTGHFRDLYVTHAVGDATGIVDNTEEHVARLGAQAGRFGSDRLTRILDLLGELASEMRWSSDPRLSLEVALTRIARPQGEMTLDALAERVEALELREPLAASSAVAPVTARIQKDSVSEADPVDDFTTATTEISAVAAHEHAVESALPEGDEGSGDDGASVSEALPVEKNTAVTVEVAPVSAAMDRAHVKRAWPAVLAEVKQAKASRASIFASTEIDLDADGSTLVVEFPSDQKFTMDLAQVAETRQLLQSSLTKVLGGRPAFRYQLGRGAVRAAETPDSAPPTDTPPVSGGDETDSRPASAPAEHGDETERLLMDELGAHKIAEHPHESKE